MENLKKTLSPMMNQYSEIKDQYPDSILFFRLGDFYEMFFEDAKLVSGELGLNLTGKGKKEPAPMCGIPYHSCESYIARLIAKGHKVAICEQIENAAIARGLVKREVVRLITPGTVMEGSMLDESRNNYICCIYWSKSFPIVGLCFCDVSTGELKVTELCGSDSDIFNELKSELGKLSPREVLCVVKSEVFESVQTFIQERLLCNNIETIEETLSDVEAVEAVKEHYKNKNCELDFLGKIAPVKSMAYLFEYLNSTQKNSLNHILLPAFYDKTQYMGLDLNTVRNLELLETMRTKSRKGSLLGVLDRTNTPMGKRMMRSWIERPLENIKKILLRQGAVEELFSNSIFRGNLREALSDVTDFQRIMTKISYASANAKDLKSLSQAFEKLPEIKSILETSRSKMLRRMYDKFDTLEDVRELIESAICDEPAFSVKEGDIIKDGFSKEVDELREDRQGGKEKTRKIEERERNRTGIPKLKVGYNRVFGYYIEVTNLYKNKIPSNYIRKQTLSGCERYTTEELKNLEERILSAQERINETEFKIFEEIRLKVAENLPRVVEMSNLIGALDVVASLAEVSVRNDYVKPDISTDDYIIIKRGRHPVIESLIGNGAFVPNDVDLDTHKNTVALITGPNMAGKSTYMRQTALIVLMAQIGGFVPADSASIGIVDSIFTRIGASDDLAAGQSTFMIEMNELADIIKNSTPRSLIILDEIGRGTSTFDGVSIAKSVLEYVSDRRKLGAKTLFATHYHELTSAADELSNVTNYCVEVKKDEDSITFLHTIVPGSVDDSYGIEVASLAGLPHSIIDRSREILKQIESKESVAIPVGALACPNKPQSDDSSSEEFTEMLKILRNVNLSSITPIESINILNKLISIADSVSD